MRKGLLAGDRLLHDLRRMEVAYLHGRQRSYEITKHISLGLLDPLALLSLRETGACIVNIPEWLFDLDHPGHYRRRIQSVSVTVPSVTGPYTSVNMRLTLLRSTVRRSPDPGADYRAKRFDDPRFVDVVGAGQSIVTSSGQDDSGLFESSLRDERYLPFEGAGAISQWRLELDPETNAFDLETVSDVILHMRYVAAEAGERMRAAAKDATRKLLSTPARRPGQPDSAGLVRLFSASRELSGDWLRWLQPNGAPVSRTLGVPVTRDRVPYLMQARKLRVNRVQVFLVLGERSLFAADDSPYAQATPLELTLTPGGTQPLRRDPSFGGLPAATFDFGAQPVAPGQLNVSIDEAKLQALLGALPPVTSNGVARPPTAQEAIDDLVVAAHYTAS
jgi:hypothetical protein